MYARGTPTVRREALLTALFVLLLGIGFFVLPSPTHAAPCNKYAAGDTAAPQYGSPTNHARGGGGLLVSGDCSGGDISVTVGDGEATTYVYQTAYQFEGSAWKPITLSGGENVGEGWLKGRASTILRGAADSGTWFVAYTCIWDDNRWKCGCHNSACSFSFWQIQRVGAPPQTTSRNLATGGGFDLEAFLQERFGGGGVFVAGGGAVGQDPGSFSGGGGSAPSVDLPGGFNGSLTGPGPNSGLPWKTGIDNCGHGGAFESAIGRKADVFVAWAGKPRDTWSQLKQVKGINGQSRGYLLSLGYAMFPDNSSHVACARGEYDNHHRELAQIIKRKRPGPLVLRIGWEANGSYGWDANKDPSRTFENYKKCFRRIAAIHRQVNSDIIIDWTLRSRGSELFRGNHSGQHLDVMYPGDDAVDIIGVDYYDSYPNTWDEASFVRQANTKSKFGGPEGIYEWAKYAASKGKPLSLPEWGLRQSPPPPSDGRKYDNPVFIRKMWEFFQANKNLIAYETYFNCKGGDPSNGDHGGPTWPIFPISQSKSPKGSQQFKQLWSR